MTASFGGKPLVDPRHALQIAAKQGAATDLWLGKANSYTCSLGCTPGVAWLLMFEAHAKELADLQSTSPEGGHNLLFDEVEKIEILRLRILSAVTVLPSPDSGGGVVLVKAVDRRYPLSVLPHTIHGINQKDTLGNFVDNLNETPSGSPGEEPSATTSPWTWSNLLANQWQPHSALIGTTPQLPARGDQIPEDFTAQGESLGEAVDFILAKLRMALAYDPMNASVDFSMKFIFVAAETQSVVEAISLNTHRVIESEGEYFFNAKYTRPEMVIVRFRARGNLLWHEEKVFHWEADAEDNGEFISRSVEYLYDDMVAEYEGEGNFDAIAERALQRARDYYLHRKWIPGEVRRVYDGIINHSGFLPNALVTSVRWGDRGRGMLTEVSTRPAIWNEIDYGKLKYNTTQDPTVFAKITGAIDGKYIPAVLTTWSIDEEEWEDSATIVHVLSPDSQELPIDSRWMVIPIGTNDEDEMIAVADSWPPTVYVRIYPEERDSDGNFSARITWYSPDDLSWYDKTDQVWVRPTDMNLVDDSTRFAAMLIGSNSEGEPLYIPLIPRDEIVFTVRPTAVTLYDEEGETYQETIDSQGYHWGVIERWAPATQEYLNTFRYVKIVPGDFQNTGHFQLLNRYPALRIADMVNPGYQPGYSRPTTQVVIPICVVLGEEPVNVQVNASTFETGTYLQEGAILPLATTPSYGSSAPYLTDCWIYNLTTPGIDIGAWTSGTAKPLPMGARFLGKFQGLAADGLPVFAVDSGWQPDASTIHSGIVNTGAQTLKGHKTFADNIVAKNIIAHANPTASISPSAAEGGGVDFIRFYAYSTGVSTLLNINGTNFVGLDSTNFLGSGAVVKAGIVVSNGSGTFLTDGDKGGITVGSSGTVWTVDEVDGGTW